MWGNEGYTYKLIKTTIEKKETINNGVGSLESEVTSLVFLVEERKQRKNSLVWIL